MPDRYQMMAFVIFRDFQPWNGYQRQERTLPFWRQQYLINRSMNIGVKEIEPYAGSGRIPTRIRIRRSRTRHDRRVIGGNIRRSCMSSLPTLRNSLNSTLSSNSNRILFVHGPS
jgi:hypothetical protein